MKQFQSLIGLLFGFLSISYGQGVSIQSGSHLVVNGNAAVVINDGSFINNGTFNSGAGSLYMKGSAPTTNSKIQASNISTFNHIVIDKTANGVQLDNSINVNGNLDMQGGTLDLNGQTLSFYFDGTILNETEDNRIWGDSGTIFKAGLLNMPSNVDLANMGLQISASQNLNVVYVRRIHGSQMINGSPSATRQYKVQYFVAGLSMDYQMKYFNAELNGINEDYLQSWQYQTDWKQQVANAIDTTTNIVQVNGLTEKDTLWALSAGMLQLSPKTLLSGAYDTGGAMKDDLRTASVIPTTEPYTALGYTMVNCPCDSTTQAVLDVTGTDAIVDWVLVELRLKTNRDSILQSVTGLLQKDGDVVDVDGLSPLKIPNLATDSFYIAVKHRNHLGIITSAFQAMSPVASTYDFTTSLSNTQGGTTGVKDLGDGFYAMYSGDVDRNGQVQNTDASLLILKLGTSGYLPEDLDMNSQVQNTDLTNKLRPHLGTGVQFNN